MTNETDTAWADTDTRTLHLQAAEFDRNVPQAWHGAADGAR